MIEYNPIKVKRGQRITVTYENRDFELIVIDPNGLGERQPSLGFGLTMMDKHAGLPQSTSSGWIKGGHREMDKKTLETPTGKAFRVIEIIGSDNNEYLVLEISDWVAVAGEALKSKGNKKVSDSTKDRLIDFLTWFATKGLYAEAYVTLKGVYTSRDSRSVSNWMMARLEGKIRRNKYTDFLKSQGCESVDYAIWTNTIYEGLFGKTAREMKQLWEVVEGDKSIARNYISEEDGLKAVAHCENLVVELFVRDLREAHEDAISNTKRKFADVLKNLI
jgi:hypothetical protein